MCGLFLMRLVTEAQRELAQSQSSWLGQHRACQVSAVVCKDLYLHVKAGLHMARALA